MKAGKFHDDDPFMDFIYMFSIYLSRQLTQIELLNYDMQKIVSVVGDGEFHVSNPVVSVLFRYYRQLTDEEITALAEGVRTAVEEHKIEYLKIELAHVGRAEKDLDGGADNDDTKPIDAVSESEGDIPPAPDTLV